MATDPRIDGFDADAVRAGLQLAMQVGLPTLVGERPVFYMPRVLVSDDPADQEGVPFAPAGRSNYAPAVAIRDIHCAIEYRDGQGKLENFGLVVPASVVLTLLDVDYVQVKGFEFVAIGGIKYFYRRTETPKGLVSVGLYKIHCNSEDEG